MERARYVWLYMLDQGILKHGRSFWHFGPEKALIGPLFNRIGESYRPLDLHPSVYENPFVEVRRFDLCNDLAVTPPGSVDVILANHILEHLPCSVAGVLAQMRQALRKGGDLLISVPISSKPETEEDLDPDLPADERILRFGQEDHLRLFGHDFRDLMAEVFGRDVMITGSRIFRPAVFERAAIPADQVSRLTSNAIFHYRKNP